MNPLLFAALMACGALWIAICHIDRQTGIPHILAILLMLPGAAIMMGWSVGIKVISQVWLHNGLTALLLGLAMWLVFDRRRP